MVTSDGNRLNAKLDPNVLMARLAALCGSFNRVAKSMGVRPSTELDLAAMAVVSTCGLFQNAVITPEEAHALVPKVQALKQSLPTQVSLTGGGVILALDTLIASLESKCQVNPAEPEKGSEE